MRNLLILLLVTFHSLTYAESISKTLLIYGDSISAGYGMPKDKQWSEDLKQIFLQPYYYETILFTRITIKPLFLIPVLL